MLKFDAIYSQLWDHSRNILWKTMNFVFFTFRLSLFKVSQSQTSASSWFSMSFTFYKCVAMLYSIVLNRLVPSANRINLNTSLTFWIWTVQHRACLPQCVPPTSWRHRNMRKNMHEQTLICKARKSIFQRTVLLWPLVNISWMFMGYLKHKSYGTVTRKGLLNYCCHNSCGRHARSSVGGTQRRWRLRVGGTQLHRICFVAVNVLQ